MRSFEVVQLSWVSVGAACLAGMAMVATNASVMADTGTFANVHLWVFTAAGAVLVLTSIALMLAKAYLRCVCSCQWGCHVPRVLARGQVVQSSSCHDDRCVDLRGTNGTE